jgi:hypothetical protein
VWFEHPQRVALAMRRPSMDKPLRGVALAGPAGVGKRPAEIRRSYNLQREPPTISRL